MTSSRRMRGFGRRASIATSVVLLLVGGSSVLSSTASAEPARADAAPFTLKVPSSIDAGDRLVVSGDGCYENYDTDETPVVVSIDGKVGTTLADANGDWTFRSEALTPGIKKVNASCDGYVDFTAYETVSVEVKDRASLSVRPGSVESGAAITLSGSGWGYECDCEPVGFVASLSNGERVWPLGASKSGKDWSTPEGDISVSLPTPADLPSGEYQVVVTQGDYHRATTSLRVGRFVPPTASVTLGSTSIAQGASLTVKGKGFLPGEVVTVRLSTSPTPLQLTTATATKSGEIEARITVPLETAAGSYRIILTGTDSARTASADLTVTPGTTTGVPRTAAHGQLASTGVTPPFAMAGVAGAILLLGVAGLLSSRRRSARV